MKNWRTFRGLSRLAALGLVLGLIVALGAPQATAGQRAAGKTLIIALDQSDMKTLDVSRQFEFAAAFICLNTYDSLLKPKSPAELTIVRPRPRHLVEHLQGRQGVHVQAPAEREVRERESLHGGGRPVHLHPTQELEGQRQLADGSAEGGPGRRPAHGEDDPERVHMATGWRSSPVRTGGSSTRSSRRSTGQATRRRRTRTTRRRSG